MDMKCETLDEAYERYQRENKQHFLRWAHEFELVKAWLADGGVVIPTRYDGLGTYLWQNELEHIMLGYTHIKPKHHGFFCDPEKLMDEGFIIVPKEHVIRKGRCSPAWFMRTRQK